MKLTEMTSTLAPSSSWPDGTVHFFPLICASFPRDNSSRPIQCPATQAHIFPYDKTLQIDWPIKLRNLFLPKGGIIFIRMWTLCIGSIHSLTMFTGQNEYTFIVEIGCGHPLFRLKFFVALLLVRECQCGIFHRVGVTCHFKHLPAFHRR